MPLTLINQHLRLASYLPALAALSVCLLTAAPVHAYKVEKICEEVKSKDGNKKICKVVRVAEKPGDKKEAVVEKDAKGKPIAPKKDAKKEEKKEEKKADPKAAAPKH